MSMKKKWIKHIGIFLCVFAICAIALYGAWRIWLDPYRGTVSTFEKSEELDTVLTGMQAAEDLEFIVNRLRERHPACVSGLPPAVQKAYEREYAELSESTEVTVLSLWQSASRVLAQLNDAHTRAQPYYENTKTLPLLFSWEGHQLICSGGEFDGYTVNLIGGVAIDDTAYLLENDSSGIIRAKGIVSSVSTVNTYGHLEYQSKKKPKNH